MMSENPSACDRSGRRVRKRTRPQEAGTTFVSSTHAHLRIDKTSACAARAAAKTSRPAQYRTGRHARCSISSHENGNDATNKADASQASDESRLHVVFVHPQIHWNTGNIGRTCLGLGATLHLIGPLGFSLDEKQVRRAGLDYWEHVDVHVYDSWDEFVNGRMKQLGGTRLFFTKFGADCATSMEWPLQGNIVMIFGSEVDGFDGIRAWLDGPGRDERRVAFPMVDERFRSFNLSTTASMVRYA